MRTISIKGKKITHLYFQLQRNLGDLDTLNNPDGRLEANLVDYQGEDLKKRGVIIRTNSATTIDIEDSISEIIIRIPQTVAKGVIRTGEYQERIKDYIIYIQDGIRPLRH